MQSIFYFFWISSKPKSIFTDDTAGVTQLLQLFFPVDLLNFAAHDTDFDSKLYLLEIFLFYANIWNIFSGGSCALSLKVE